MPPCCSSLLFRSRVALLLRATATSAFFFSLPPRARNCRLNGYARPGVCAQVTTPVVVVRKGVRGRLHAAVVGIMQRVFHGRRVERRCSSVLRAARGCYGLIFPLCSDRPLVPRLLVSSLPVLFSFPSLPKIPSDTWIYIYIYIYTHTLVLDLSPRCSVSCFVSKGTNIPRLTHEGIFRHSPVPRFQSSSPCSYGYAEYSSSVVKEAESVLK